MKGRQWGGGGLECGRGGIKREKYRNNSYYAFDLKFIHGINLNTPLKLLSLKS